MNTTNNARFNETENKIIDAYSKLASSKEISKITVSDVCNMAGIHRTTFYGHYEDVIDLQHKLLSLQFQVLLDAFQVDGSWDFNEGIYNQVNFFYENRKIIKKHLTSSNNPSLSLGFDNEIVKTYEHDYMRAFKCYSLSEAKYHQTFFAAGYSAVITEWILSDCPESPSDIAKYICRIYNISND